MCIEPSTLDYTAYILVLTTIFLKFYFFLQNSPCLLQHKLNVEPSPEKVS